MSYISYFVIKYDHETQGFEFDPTTCAAHFPDGYVCHTSDGEYLKPSFGSVVQVEDDLAATKLIQAVNNLNYYTKLNKENDND
jgi:hypothetical protein